MVQLFGRSFVRSFVPSFVCLYGHPAASIITWGGPGSICERIDTLADWPASKQTSRQTDPRTAEEEQEGNRKAARSPASQPPRPENNSPRHHARRQNRIVAAGSSHHCHRGNPPVHSRSQDGTGSNRTTQSSRHCTRNQLCVSLSLSLSLSISFHISLSTFTCNEGVKHHDNKQQLHGSGNHHEWRTQPSR